jgi:colanic acid biosynthesis glycosyl transferase WcaI
MRVCVHDYSGHPFQVELSRSLARRGHEVLHLYSGSFLTPQGALQKTGSDPATFDVEPVVLGEAVAKNDLLKRRRQDKAHGLKAAERIARFRPDVLLCANTPLDGLKVMQESAHRHGAAFVFWVQDLIGQAALRILGAKYGPLGRLVGSLYVGFEHRTLVRSEAVVLISEDFRPWLPSSLRADPRVHVIENWAPLGDMPARPRANAWGMEHGLEGQTVVLYSGTLGMKHNPDLLVRLAQAMQDAGEGRMVVVSEGESVEYLRRRRDELGLQNLDLLGFQPFSALPDVLASADVLVAILEPSAGVFSVPSKVLTYHCAGRAILLAVPSENLCARIVLENGSGVVAPPTDADEFVRQGMRLVSDAAFREEAGKNARAYAERTFDIEAITDRFEVVLGSVRPSAGSNAPS